MQLFLSRERLLIHRSLGTLQRKLRQPNSGQDILLVFLSSRARLAEFIGLRDLVGDMRLVLVLPDREQGTVALGHLLRPRLISYRDGDFLDVASVLVRMLEKDVASLPMDAENRPQASGRKAASAAGQEEGKQQ
jgi:hypothetical protein